jgi:hypothetical protein
MIATMLSSRTIAGESLSHLDVATVLENDGGPICGSWLSHPADTLAEVWIL